MIGRTDFVDDMDMLGFALWCKAAFVILPAQPNLQKMIGRTGFVDDMDLLGFASVQKR